MWYRTNRREFLQTAAATGGAMGLGGLNFLSKLPTVSADEAQPNPEVVRLRPEIEPLVKLLEETPRQQLLEQVADELKRGLGYQKLLAALQLAGVRNVQPRPVGFKFHAVLVINSAHLASMACPGSDRWLPIFWALDYFKDSQARDAQQGDWAMEPVDESAVPASHKARQAFMDAMEKWDVAAADAAVVGLVRNSGAQAVFEAFCQYGARDFRDIGHKAIFTANSWRALQVIGWRHAEPIMRSLAYALLQHEGDNPARRDATADRPWRENQERSDRIRSDWTDGVLQPSATADLLATLRHASPAETSEKVVTLLNEKVSPQSIWDALFEAGGELLMRRPGILSLHALTTTNAIRHAFDNVADDRLRRLLLLQNAAFLPLFRRSPEALRPIRIDELEPLSPNKTGSEAIDEIFADVSNDPHNAARKLMGYLNDHPSPTEWVRKARQLIFLKGANAHDYKFSSAVLEDYLTMSPRYRKPFLAASLFNLKGSDAPDNQLVARTQAALDGLG